MAVFLLLVGKLLPLYLLIALGFVAGRLLNADRRTVGSLLIYLIAPLVVFHGTATSALDATIIALPLATYACSCLIGLGFFLIGRRLLKDERTGILGFTAGTGNTGYFGLPVAIALFGETATGPLVVAALGTLLYENTVGFYLTAKGKHTAADSLRKVLKLPTVYAFAAGLTANALHIPLGAGYLGLIANVRGAYAVLGMMLIGLGLAAVRASSIDKAFTGLCFLAKFVAWPAVMTGVIALDRAWLGLFTPLMTDVLILISIVPMAANTVAVATVLDVHPEKAAFAVLLSTLASLVVIPLVATLAL
jgi:malate permease and related proteins